MKSNSRIATSPTVISDIDQEYLIHSFQMIRLSQGLSLSAAIRSMEFWRSVQNEMQSHGRRNSADGWQLVWQRMHSKLLVRIEKARRMRRTGSSWLTTLNQRLLQVLMDDFDGDRLEYLERCLADDVSDDEDRLVLCAAVYRDIVADGFVMRCQQCRQTFAKAEDMLSHIRRYYEDTVAYSEMIEPEENGTEVDVGNGSMMQFLQQAEPFQSDIDDIPSVRNVLSNKHRPMQSNFTTKPSEQSEEDDELPTFDQTYDHAGDDGSTSDSNGEDLDSKRRIIKLHDSIFKFPCDRCRKRFSTHKQRHEHSVAVHDCASLLCPHCTAKFEDPKMLADHVKEHKQKFQCDICKRFSVGKGNLRIHMRIHDNSKDFQCTKCSERFRYSFQRDNHLQKKHGSGFVKPIICEQCARPFRFAYELRKHLPRCTRRIQVKLEKKSKLASS